MDDPVLVEVTRGGRVESRHRGAIAILDADGAVHTALGDIGRAIFPRSAVKSIQALPLVESGAADTFGFSEKELALACASHSGEPAHVALAASMLERAGLDGTALECGAHWPSRQEVTIELARSGATPTALHNNCSGKHSGFLSVCSHCGVDHHGYVRMDHRLQDMVRDALEGVTGAPHGLDNSGTDGCSIPTYAIPLKSLALGFARMATGTRLGPKRAAAAKRLFSACMAEPFYVAGSGRACTKIMEAGKGRVFVKTGAEGVYCAAVPELGLGIALKCDDGAGRASETVVCAVLAHLLRDDAGLSGKLANLAQTTLRNWNGIEVGGVHPAFTLTSAG
ncbi:MAG: asparaginase [Hyphomicrobiales bacterium]|nr:asparaginase [Hyphomicrobiales bacterium]